MPTAIRATLAPRGIFGMPAIQKKTIAMNVSIDIMTAGM